MGYISTTMMIHRCRQFTHTQYSRSLYNTKGPWGSINDKTPPWTDKQTTWQLHIIFNSTTDTRPHRSFGTKRKRTNDKQGKCNTQNVNGTIIWRREGGYMYTHSTSSNTLQHQGAAWAGNIHNTTKPPTHRGRWVGGSLRLLELPWCPGPWCC